MSTAINRKHARDILIAPVVSEKSYGLLDEGKYTLIVDPRSNKTVSAFARVSAGKRSETSASFPTLSAEEYLKNAGL